MAPDNGARLYVGNLADDVTEQELLDEFETFGRITRCTLKHNSRPGSTGFAFIEFENPRDADAAVRERDRTTWRGQRLRVEVPFNERSSGHRDGGSRRGHAPRRGEYVIEVSGLPPSGSWQDLKDHFREAGEIVHTDVFKHGYGEVSFHHRSDMERALDKMSGSLFRSHDDETARISVRRLRTDDRYRRSRSRSRSPRYSSPRRRRSPSRHSSVRSYDSERRSPRRRPSLSPVRRRASPSPVRRRASPSPVRRRTSPSPVRRRTSPSPVRRRTSPSPVRRRASPSPAHRRTSPSPARRRDSRSRSFSR